MPRLRIVYRVCAIGRIHGSRRMIVCSSHFTFRIIQLKNRGSCRCRRCRRCCDLAPTFTLFLDEGQVVFLHIRTTVRGAHIHRFYRFPWVEEWCKVSHTFLHSVKQKLMVAITIQYGFPRWWVIKAVRARQ